MSLFACSVLGIILLSLSVYLFYALIHPEKF